MIIYGKPRFLGRIAIEDNLPEGAPVVIETPRGLELGLLAGKISETSSVSRAVGDPQTEDKGNALHDVKFVQVATVEQMVNAEEDRKDETAYLAVARRLLMNHQLEIKVVDLEYLLDRKKLFFYFTCDGRVDFRAFVRDLAREFKTRIELRQICARDEAKVVGGLGSCGRPCCCNSFLYQFAPINIRMVKEQNLSLNPTKISGLCGRLMCCMSYEQNVYSEVWKSLPQSGTKVKAEHGTYILLGVDVARKTCQIKGPKGFFWLPVQEFARFRETVKSGVEWDNEVQGFSVDGQELEIAVSDQSSDFIGLTISSKGKRCHGCAGGSSCECNKRRAAMEQQRQKEGSKAQEPQRSEKIPHPAKNDNQPFKRRKRKKKPFNTAKTE